MCKELLETIARNLVDDPEAVRVTTREAQDDTVVLELRVAPDDMGRVIGKQGKIAKAIRAVIKAAATKENVKVQVDIVD
ncbi:KH domain-containing protein [Feifania hominis]|uniref:RNA-binding protein KhpA n=1 Tax=Feifania hominis TaxID=2763660 RepID=A0A926DD76_9FIRM|nr:KH domain-containing protein [Feifania hominis]MBC8535169.1 KH domain-containing protein [Feifania hominis]